MELMTLIPTENVGSLPRPSCKVQPYPFTDPLSTTSLTDALRIDLQDALKGWDEGTVTEEEVRKAQDKAAEDSVRRMEQTGQAVVTDGEQRVSS